MECFDDVQSPEKLNALGEGDGLVFRDAYAAPFDLYQCVSGPGEPFRRMPAEAAARVSESVAYLARHTSGIRLRFRTDSARIALKVRISDGVLAMNHMPLTGSCGFDLFFCENGRQRFAGFLAPGRDCRAFGGVQDFGRGGMRDVLIDFPLYNTVDEVRVGLDEGAALEHGGRYRPVAPVLYYGSSITQGGCADRPGDSYQAMISRRYDLDFVNQGYNGSARAEDAMVDWLCTFEPSVFVCDYDHNAPSVEYLEQTHFRLYRRYRAARPDTPVIFVTKPDTDLDPAGAAARRAVIRRTFDRAVAEGDRNVRFVDGGALCGDGERSACFVDGCHPTTLGFFRMAEGIGAVIAELLGL
ncbi:MAG: SGNH/GDSL hydrolase family protein [Oscillospiraceae bacterium]|nr:SGNH/GDSL hydrolase family protein [Oscillospiraceae bacterium]